MLQLTHTEKRIKITERNHTRCVGHSERFNKHVIGIPKEIEMCQGFHLTP